MKFLIIEDDEYKKEKIVHCLKEKYVNFECKHVQSVSSALNELELLDEETIVLLDMSLPTYDLNESNSGGRPQGFGGIEILRNMDYFELVNHVIVITQYETIMFDNRLLDANALKVELASEFPDNFYDLIQFNVTTDAWKGELLDRLDKIST